MDVYDDDGTDESSKSKTKKVELWALEFEWIFKGDTA
jgi:hypothetical protein